MAKPQRQKEEDVGPAAPAADNLFSDVLRELDAERSRIIVRLELRRFRKKTTVIEGLSGAEEDLANVARELKKRLATGGSVKDGIIVLQGDQREKAKEILSALGYSNESIEVQ